MNRQSAEMKRRTYQKADRSSLTRASIENRQQCTAKNSSSLHDPEKELLAKDNEILNLRVAELRNLLSSARQELKQQRNESNAATKLLRLQLNHLQKDLQSSRQEQTQHTAETTREKDMLLQQNDQLQEQMELYLTKYRQASAAVNTLSTFVQISPRLQLINRTHRFATE